MSKLLFTRGPSLTIRLALVMLASVILMTVDHRQNHLDGLRSALSVLVYPLQLLVDLPESAGGWFRETLASRRALAEENARLRTEHLILKAQLQKLEALEAENLRLRELLDSSFKVGERVLIAELLSVDLDPWRHQILINKGSRDGVFVGQPLLDAQGVVGQVIAVTPFTATAMLITDPAHALPVQVNRSGLRSVALGIGSLERLSLPHIPNSADIAAGDLLVTSGLGGRFPPGYPVARVEAVTRDPGQSFARIYARPLAELDRAREVLLVWTRERAGGEATDAAEAADEGAPAP
ncbi:rod shape-determining protein MreC [Thiohalobacter sp.]|uniref:rod shape-determining protein MreC n=1 Tax=Thiohalobacter sp. TaxID=2025948 RepID=UPI0026104F75|nr:rod shape-determining protein MreC [Thiohalobacter sp.]